MLIEMTGVEIVVGIAAVLFAPAASGFFGSRAGLNGMRRDVTAIKNTVAEIQATQSEQATAIALADQRVDTIVRHCEFIHERPISEHPRQP